MTRIKAETRSNAMVSLFILGITIVVVGCGAQTDQIDEQPVVSFFPLAVGNEWVYEVPDSDRKDTLRIDAFVSIDEVDLYHFTGPWMPFWVIADSVGNLFWSVGLETMRLPFLLFDAETGESWASDLGIAGCGGSWMADDDAVVETPYGNFDDARHIVISSACLDTGLEVVVVRGVGPVRWDVVTFTPETWLLKSAIINSESGLSKSATRSRILNTN